MNIYIINRYTQSLVLFNNITTHDPNCCIAYWGAAATFSHPVWDYIPDDRLAHANAYANNALECSNNNILTEMEKGFIYSITDYFNIDPLILPADRLMKYANDINEFVYIPFGDKDDNAGVMYGLALIGVGYYNIDEPINNFPNLMKAGLVEEMTLLKNIDSPGALHYIIHSYDQPSLATRALSAANKYLNTSVLVPHALHMPSHIYSDLGMWDDMINANILSMNSAYKFSPKPSGDWYHASYFLQFGMLQLAMDCNAKNLVTTMQTLSTTFGDEALEAAVRIPTHYYIETRNFEEGAEFNLEKFYRSQPNLWEKNPWTKITAEFVVTVSRAILNYPLEDIAASRYLNYYFLINFNLINF